MKFSSKYQRKYCNMLIKHCMSGRSLSSFAASIHVSRDTLYQWAKDHPEFDEAKKIAKAQLFAYWEKYGRDACLQKFNFGVWLFMMRNLIYEKDSAPSQKEEQETIIILKSGEEREE